MIITILNYTVGEVIIKNVPKELENLDGDDILINMGYSMSDTEFMVVDDDLTINIDTKDCSSKLTLK